MDKINHGKEKSAPKAMIISVGGTPAPIIKTICVHKPEFVSFLASQDSCDLISKIKTGIEHENISIKSRLTLVDNVNDLLHCHQKAEEAIKYALSEGFEKNEVTVDYTGGTKNMSVALALASVSSGFPFSYVGGKERTKNGLGIVKDGEEEIYDNVNPWDFLAIEERKKIGTLFNQYQFKAAQGLADMLVERSGKYRAVFKKIGFLIKGYYKWDLFCHQDAIDAFERAKISDIFDGEDNNIMNFSDAAKRHLNYLRGKVNPKNKHASLFLILDLYSNAQRRFEEGRTDDAILRLYRVTEMIAQEKLINHYGIDTSNVRPDQLPERISEEFIIRYKDPRTGAVKIPQTASYVLLGALNDDLGRIFETHQSLFKDIQSSRNYSYLAHGFKSSSEKTYEKLRDFVLRLNVFEANDVPLFPKLSL